jgi:hypothetical protein
MLASFDVGQFCCVVIRELLNQSSSFSSVFLWQLDGILDP